MEKTFFVILYVSENNGLAIERLHSNYKIVRALDLITSYFIVNIFFRRV